MMPRLVSVISYVVLDSYNHLTAAVKTEQRCIQYRNYDQSQYCGESKPEHDRYRHGNKERIAKQWDHA